MEPLFSAIFAVKADVLRKSGDLRRMFRALRAKQESLLRASIHQIARSRRLVPRPRAIHLEPW